MAQIIDGKMISTNIKNELRLKVEDLKKQGKECTLVVIQVGNDPASTVYVSNKKKACEYIGINSRSYELPEETTEEELLNLIDDLNNDDTVQGILCQLPLPKHINEKKVIDRISPKKDVDGFHPQNVGALVIGEQGFVSCTPAGIIELLKKLLDVLIVWLVIYYILKTTLTLRNMKKEYYKSQNDIKEIVRKGNKKND